MDRVLQELENKRKAYFGWVVRVSKKLIKAGCEPMHPNKMA